MKNKRKCVINYKESDVSTLISDYLLELMSPDGFKFKTSHKYHNVVTLKIGTQSFIITVADKEKLS
jgi:hypothetical protein